ncbi:alpha/beta fold hydrolase [Paenibacillus caui]|uniref:alpha/beta fold hydrolase n=1 Tax=Paenibacillus caui TaxID=2873927 RepID=UPI001F2D4E73|nr:alpha/beta fold hydrolase [Paenibacillus caui]
MLGSRLGTKLRIPKESLSFIKNKPYPVDSTRHHHEPNVIEGHINAVIQAILSHNRRVTLVGHSYGGLIAAKVLEKIPDRIHAIHLLQPVLHPVSKRYKSSTLTKNVLQFITESTFKKMLVSQTCFADYSEIPQHYVTYVLEELNSPRVRKTLAETLASLTHNQHYLLNFQAWPKDKVSILWGTKDHMYHIPSQFSHFNIMQVPYGHHFPISHPEMTAHLLKQLMICESDEESLL